MSSRWRAPTSEWSADHGSAIYELILRELADGGGWPCTGKPACVLSSRDLRKPYGEAVDVRIVSANVGDLYDELVAAAGERHIWIVGGGNIASRFATRVCWTKSW